MQLLDIMYPGKIPMSKLNWGAKKDHEYVNNYKLLQTCFTKFKIDRVSICDDFFEYFMHLIITLAHRC